MKNIKRVKNEIYPKIIAEKDLNMITKIYVKILNEDLIVYRPVLANSIRENTFKIIDEQNFLDDFDEELEFAFGDIVKCKKIDNCYYAFKKIKIKNKNKNFRKLQKSRWSF